jgi:glycosyltransferase involved in cell wall biosynthesis
VLDHITPVLLTYNEEQNIGRTLSRLSWARDIVVVDSGSTDSTLNLLKAYPNVRVFNRRFDTHANQWRYAMENTQIATDWIFRLDADYLISDALVSEPAQLDPNAPVNAYRIGFDYAIFSEKLISSLYLPKTILLRKGKFNVRGRGHTDQWDMEGFISSLSGRVVHDDWKPTAQWITAQSRYMQRESDWLRVGGEG